MPAVRSMQTTLDLSMDEAEAKVRGVAELVS
jgi:hypothetical protein